MGVVPGSLGGKQPICNTCGIAESWEISEKEYRDNKAFWDQRQCEECQERTPPHRRVAQRRMYGTN